MMISGVTVFVHDWTFYIGKRQLLFCFNCRRHVFWHCGRVHLGLSWSRPGRYSAGVWHRNAWTHRNIRIAIFRGVLAVEVAWQHLSTEEAYRLGVPIQRITELIYEHKVRPFLQQS